MNKEELNTKKAFSLVEVLVALSILAMLLTNVFVLFSQGNKAAYQTGEQISIQSTARNVMSWIVRDLRSSSTGVINTTLNSTNIAVAVGNFTYELNTAASPNVLRRNGANIGSGVRYIDFYNNLDVIDVEVSTYTNDVNIIENEFSLLGRVKKRNN